MFLRRPSRLTEAAAGKATDCHRLSTQQHQPRRAAGPRRPTESALTATAARPGPPGQRLSFPGPARPHHDARGGPTQLCTGSFLLPPYSPLSPLPIGCNSSKMRRFCPPYVCLLMCTYATLGRGIDFRLQYSVPSLFLSLPLCGGDQFKSHWRPFVGDVGGWGALTSAPDSGRTGGLR